MLLCMAFLVLEQLKTLEENQKEIKQLLLGLKGSTTEDINVLSSNSSQDSSSCSNSSDTDSGSSSDSSCRSDGKERKKHVRHLKKRSLKCKVPKKNCKFEFQYNTCTIQIE